jgi:hypothetical protein
MEKKCHREIEMENFMSHITTPDLDDTLDEINFILELGNRLKEKEESERFDANKDSAISSTVGESMLENESEIVNDSMENTLDDSVIEICEKIEEITIENSLLENSVIEIDD